MLTGPQSSSAQSVRPAHQPHLAPSPTTLVILQQGRNADKDNSEVPGFPAQADSLQPNPWRYVLGKQDTETRVKLMNHRSIPLPCSIQDVLEDSPWYDPTQDRPWCRRSRAPQDLRGYPTTIRHPEAHGRPTGPARPQIEARPQVLHCRPVRPRVRLEVPGRCCSVCYFCGWLGDQS